LLIIAGSMMPFLIVLTTSPPATNAPDASKIAFVELVEHLARWDIELVDCQVHTEHLEHFGATQWPRKKFLDALKVALKSQTRLGPWQFGA
jgi:leucyl/phenylalanyl-tRNA--protein transferase